MAKFTVVDDPSIVDNGDGTSTVNTPVIPVSAQRLSPDNVEQAIAGDKQGRFTVVDDPTVGVTTTTEPAAGGLKLTAGDRFGRGLKDVGQGIAQAAFNTNEALQQVAKDAPAQPSAFSNVGKNFKNNAPTADQYTKQVSDEIAQYDQSYQNSATPSMNDLITGNKPYPGIDWWRLGGNLTATLPLVAVPGGAAESMGARMLSGGVGGGVGGGAMFADPAKDESRAQNAAVGFGGGAITPAIFQGISKAVRGFFNRANPQQIDDNAINQAVQMVIERNGIPEEQVTPDLFASLTNDVKYSLAADMNLDPTQLSRKADIEAVGATPTQASLTRDPRQWQFEKNTRGIAGVGDPLLARDVENSQALVNNLVKQRENMGASTATQYGTGESAIGSVRKSFKDSGDEVSNLYKVARETLGGEKTIPTGRRAATLNSALGVKQPVADQSFNDDAMEVLNRFEGKVPASVVKRLKELGISQEKLTEPTRNLTVNEGEKLINLINDNYDPMGHKAEKAALDALRNGLKKALDNVGADSEAAVAFKEARSAAHERFQKFAPKNLKGITEGNITPDKFVDQRILGGKIQELRSLKSVISEQDPQVWKDVKGQVIDKLIMSATGATNPDDITGKAFSGVRFSKALDKIEPERLNLLFTPNEIASLRTLQRASKYLTEDVPMSDRNFSGTASALANLVQKMPDVPFLGAFVKPVLGLYKTGADWSKDANARKAVEESLLGMTKGIKKPVANTPVKSGKFIAPSVGGALAAPNSDR